jgi:predicted RNA binding protein YcfA (HicA-like mRNA interferase family)
MAKAARVLAALNRDGRVEVRRSGSHDFVDLGGA